MPWPDPYAAKNVIQHEYEGTTLYIWLTFPLPMKLSSDPLATPPVFDVKPPDAKWLVYLDTVLTAITSSEWLDLYTMLLTIEAVAAEPDKVTIAYDGPDPDLRTVWDKQWEPWAIIESYTGWPTTFKVGMIILWSGSVVSIPAGWRLCDGDEGTPDLRDRFVVGVGTTYNPNDIGGSDQHNHSSQALAKATTLPAGTDLAAGANFNKVSSSHIHTIAVTAAYNLPPYYALCYIMKL
jgi:hypothetical protein